MPSPDRWRLIARYVTGDASDAEQKEIRAWVAGDAIRQELVKQVKVIYDAGGEEAVEQIDVDAAWRQVFGSINDPRASTWIHMLARPPDLHVDQIKEVITLSEVSSR